MALVTGGFTTYSAVGNREDLTDAIYNISPTKNPVMSMLPRTRAKNVLHEWQTDNLATATTANALLEGGETTRVTSSPTTRQQNYCQIVAKNATVTGTQESANSAGRKSEMAYQMAKRSKELKNDIETIISGAQGYEAGDSTTARKLRSFEAWLSSNESRATDGAAATQASSAPTDGTTRTFTETILKDVIQQCYSSGGEPTTLVVGPVNKQRVSDFTGRASARQNIGAKQIQAAASMYASDFGDLKIVPSLFSRERSALLIDPEMAAVAYYRPFTQFPLAKVGDADSRVILAELTLEMRNEAAHGIAADLKTT